jgi:hypothetical protein
MNAFDFLESKNLNSECAYTHIPTGELALLLEEYHLINTVKVEITPGLKEQVLSAIEDVRSALEEKIDQRFKSLKISYE